MRTKVAGTTHTKYFDNCEPAILEAIEALPLIKDLKTGSFKRTGSSRRQLKLRPKILSGKVEAILVGWLYLKAMKRQLTIYAEPSATVEALGHELCKSLEKYDVAVSITNEEDTMKHFENNGQVVLPQGDQWIIAEYIYEGVKQVKGLEEQKAVLLTQLDSIREQEEDTKAKTLEALKQAMGKEAQG